MYGMVNKAIEDLICSRFGREVWEETKERAGVEVDAFISNDAYPDDVTYRLVAAASEVTGLLAHDILLAFGEHWVLKIARTEYAGLLEAGGRTLREFLINLPNFHARISLIFPNLQPPRFRVSEATDHSLQLHYLTHRDGLAAFVIGIIRGLGQMFGNPVEITQLAAKQDGADHDIFLLQWDSSETGATS